MIRTMVLGPVLLSLVLANASAQDPAWKHTGTTTIVGVVGLARHLAGGQGVFGGDQIPDYPSGASSHSTETWLRAEKPNGTVIGWGNEQAQGKVVMQYRSPPHVNMDCYCSGGNVVGNSIIPMHQWAQVVEPKYSAPRRERHCRADFL